MKFAFLLGRMVFGGFFLYNGINHFRQRKQMAEYVRSKGLPRPEAAVLGSGALLVLGGTSILLGIKPRLGALAVAGFLAGASATMHDFWKDEDPNQRQNNLVHFMKNVALLGGAVAMLGMDEPWPASVPVAQPTAMERVRDFMEERLAA